MLDSLEYNRNTRNGKDGPRLPGTSGLGLGNTNPVATRGSTFGADAPVPYKTVIALVEVPGYTVHEFPLEQSFLLQGPTDISVVTHSRGSAWFAIEARAEHDAKALKPAGQVVLFKKVMEDWGFKQNEAATLLGFETGSDIKEIYLGLRPIEHRDANDRLRAVLRIAADLDALFQDVDPIKNWLNEPQNDLGGKTPRALLNEGSMEMLLQVKYYVSYLSGR